MRDTVALCRAVNTGCNNALCTMLRGNDTGRGQRRTGASPTWPCCRQWNRSRNNTATAVLTIPPPDAGPRTQCPCPLTMYGSRPSVLVDPIPARDHPQVIIPSRYWNLECVRCWRRDEGNGVSLESGTAFVDAARQRGRYVSSSRFAPALERASIFSGTPNRDCFRPTL
jgi:hypothetical protein